MTKTRASQIIETKGQYWRRKRRLWLWRAILRVNQLQM